MAIVSNSASARDKSMTLAARNKLIRRATMPGSNKDNEGSAKKRSRDPTNGQQHDNESLETTSKVKVEGNTDLEMDRWPRGGLPQSAMKSRN